MKLTIKRIPESLRYPLLVFSLILLSFLISSFHNPIPTDAFSNNPEHLGSIGLGANYLDIGDRQFYINFGNNDYGYGKIKGGILYPFLLRQITNFTNFFNYGRTFLWNLLVIGLTSIISILNLVLVDSSAKNIFGNRIAKISNWLYIACPYTIFYALNGGLTMFVVLGTTLITFVITNSYVFRKDNLGYSYLETNFYLFLIIIYISLLRPTCVIFGLASIFLFNICSFLKINSGSIKVLKIQRYLGLTFLIISIIFGSKLLLNYMPYLTYSIDSFRIERGTFFGVERNLLSERFSNSSFGFTSIKNNIYFMIWKLSDFVSGISDIRDTHRDLSLKPLFPFLMRVITGIFYIYPVNLLSIGGVLTFRKRILDSGLFIVLVASILVLLPSLIGAAFTRYLIMVYPPFIICCASTINLFFEEGRAKNL